MSEKTDVIVLAGDRGPDDPLALQARVAGKALVPVAGKSMLERVLSVLRAWPRLGRIILVAPGGSAYRQAAATAGWLDDPALVWLEPRGSLAASVRAGVAAGQGSIRLVLTADHALLDTTWLDCLMQAVFSDQEAQVLVGVTGWDDVMARFPGSRRTRYRFRDCAICGTNLFALREPGAARLLDLWQGIEQQRKRPWRIVALLGWRNLAAYLAGRLSLNAAFEALSMRIGVNVRPVFLRDPLTAVDVDSLADLALVESVLFDRERVQC